MKFHASPYINDSNQIIGRQRSSRLDYRCHHNCDYCQFHYSIPKSQSYIKANVDLELFLDQSVVPYKYGSFTIHIDI